MLREQTVLARLKKMHCVMAQNERESLIDKCKISIEEKIESFF